MTGVTMEVLSGVGPDRERWLRAWSRCGREPFAHPDYVRLLASPEDEPRLLVAHGAHGTEILPLSLRPLAALPWAPPGRACDATSPYGYGGPYAETGKAATKETWMGLSDLLREQGVVTWFGRLALHAPASGEDGTETVCRTGAGSTTVRADALNVVVSLARTEPEQWRRYAPKVRKNVSKALRAGMQATVGPQFRDLGEFAELYAATMDRRRASSWYRFDRTFFTELTTRLQGHFLAAEVRDRSGRLVSAELVLRSDRRVYSFLGGTHADAFPHAPNDLLKHVVINHARSLGAVEYVLGGGYAPDDGIFRYKRSFEPTGVVAFRRVEMVVDPAAHARLVALRLGHERATDPAAGLRAGHFPAYRSGLLDVTERDVVSAAPAEGAR